MKALENSAKIAEIQSRLNKYSYLSKTSLPGYADGKVFQLLQSFKRFPDRSTNPNFYHWYILMKQFSASTISKWIADQLYFDADDILISEFVRVYTKKQQTQIVEETRPRTENVNQFEYTVYITMNNKEKVKTLEKIFEEYGAEPIQIEEKENSRLIRVICRMDTAKNTEMVNKITGCTQVANVQIKKQPMKGTFVTTAEKIVNQS